MSDLLTKAASALKHQLALGEGPIAAMLELEAPPSGARNVPLGGTQEATGIRRAAREQAAGELARHTAATLSALEQLGLAPRGGQHVPFVAVRGSADAIRAALELPGVVSAVLASSAKPPPSAVDRGGDQ